MAQSRLCSAFFEHRGATPCSEPSPEKVGNPKSGLKASEGKNAKNPKKAKDKKKAKATN